VAFTLSTGNIRSKSRAGLMHTCDLRQRGESLSDTILSLPLLQTAAHAKRAKAEVGALGAEEQSWSFWGAILRRFSRG
jgi:hypothetical protein